MAKKTDDAAGAVPASTGLHHLAETHHMKTERATFLVRALATAAVFAPALAQAHPGHAGHGGGIGSGLMHPFTGLDHLLAALAIGLWAALRDRASRRLPIIAFVAGTLLGSGAGWSLGAFAGMDAFLAATLLLIGGSLAAGLRPGMSLACGVAGASAFVHGWVHGAEVPMTGDAVAYLAGVILGTASICAIGLSTAQLFRGRSAFLSRGFGAAVTIIAAMILGRSL